MIARLLAFVLCFLAPRVGAAEAPEFRRGETPHYDFEWRPGLDGFARHLMEQVEGEHARIYAALGAEADEKTRVSLVEDADEMLALVAERGRGRAPEWAAGLAYPRLREIYLHTAPGRDELSRTLSHEIVHVALGVATDDRRIPRWFHEGLAIRLTEGVALERVRLLTEAALADGLIDLDRLDAGFPEGGARAGVAYAQAVHFVGYLRDRQGDAAFAQLMRALRSPEVSFAEAVARVYSETLPEIEQAWRGTLRLWWGWVPVIFGTTTLWATAAVLLVVAWRRRRGQNRRRLDDLAAEEAVETLPELHVRPGATPPRLHDPYDGRPPTIH